MEKKWVVSMLKYYWYKGCIAPEEQIIIKYVIIFTVNSL